MRRIWQVVIVVLSLGMVTGILLVALTRLREAAVRMECANNLKSLAIALHTYHDTYKTFPAGTVANPALPPERRLSWLFALDPFVHARMDPDWGKWRDKAWDARENIDLTRDRMPWFVCPGGADQEASHGLAVTHYVGLAGVGEDAAAWPARQRGIGVFGHDRGTSLADIKDGTATTLMVTETTRRIGPWVAGGHATVRGLVPGEASYLGPGLQFGGTHRGGVLGIFADGTARFLHDSASAESFEALATIADNDPVDPTVWSD